MAREHLETMEGEDMGFSIYLDDDEDITVWVKVGMASFELPPGLTPEFVELMQFMLTRLEVYANVR